MASDQESPDIEAELYLELGNALVDNTLGLKPISKEEVIQLGEKWYRASLTVIKKHLCNEQVKAELTKHKEPSELIAAVADILVGCSFPDYIPVLSVSRLCVYVGLGTMCGKTQ